MERFCEAKGEAEERREDRALAGRGTTVGVYIRPKISLYSF